MDRLMKKLGLLALCTGLSFAVHAVTPQAEAPAEQNVKIDSVVVTGARYASDIRHLPMTVSVVGREKIEQSLQPSLLPTLTEQVPGLFTTARGIMGYGVSDGAAGGISLRGLKERINVSSHDCVSVQIENSLVLLAECGNQHPIVGRDRPVAFSPKTVPGKVSAYCFSYVDKA